MARVKGQKPFTDALESKERHMNKDTKELFDLLFTVLGLMLFLGIVAWFFTNAF